MRSNFAEPADVQEIRVASWLELQNVLFEETWQPEIRRFRSRFVYRGVADAGKRLLTSLQNGSFEPHETHLLNSFRKYAKRSSVAGESTWNWLSLAKHHGLPTRLLDWSYSPYVALHFATQDLSQFDRDAVIWCVDFRSANETLPSRLFRPLEAADANIFTAELLGEIAPDIESLQSLTRHDFVLFFEPPSLDDRIVNQFALFSLPSSAHLDLETFLESQTAPHRRVVIPAAMKWEVRDKLDQANVTERVLFPGLDGLCAWLKRYFYTRAEGMDEAVAESDRTNQPDPGRE